MIVSQTCNRLNELTFSHLSNFTRYYVTICINFGKIGTVKIVLKMIESFTKIERMLERDFYMFFNFTFRHYFAKPEKLALDLQRSEMRGLWQRIVLLMIAGFLLYGIRNLWGVNTENLTAYLATSTADYTIARYAALVGSLVWSVVYFAFHIFAIAYVFHFIFGIEFKKLLPMQLIVTSFIIIEKLLVFLSFVVTKTTTSVSFLSFGPLAATFMEIPFFIFLFNQLTITTAIIIGFQFQFINTFVESSKKHRLLWMLIGIHLLMAIFIASISLLPLDHMLNSMFGGAAK